MRLNKLLPEWLCALLLISSFSGPLLADSKYDFGASILLDYDSFDSLFSDEDVGDFSDNEVRRARVSLKSKHNDYFSSKIQLDYDPETSKIEYKDVYLSFTGFDDFWLDVGQQKEPFGLEKLNSLRKSQFIERSIATQSIAPGRNKGISIAMDRKTWFWKLGQYKLNSKNKQVKPRATTGRIGWVPFNSKKLNVHFALAASSRKLFGEKYKINERIEVHTSDSVVEGKSLKAAKVILKGAELIIQRKAFSFVSEIQNSSVRDTKDRQRNYRGYYWQLGYRITGEAHKYEMGKFGGIKPNSKYGAWELTYRQSELDLKKENQVVRSKTYGLNYYFRKSTKLMFNYIDASNQDKDELTDGKAYSLRFQYSY